MSKVSKYLSYILLILALASVLVAGLFLVVYMVHQPIRQKVVVSSIAAREAEVSPEVRRAGRSYYDTLHPDGTMTRSFTLGTGAYLADHGEYKPIDTTISKTAGEYQYENTTNVFQTYFKDNGKSDRLVSYNLVGSSAQFAFVGGKDSVALAKDNTITYPGVLDGIDAKYTITGDKLLEELIADEKPQTDTFTQKLYLTGVYYKVEQDGSISFHDEKTKNIVFIMPRPVMYEQNNPEKANFGLHYELTKDGDSYLISKVIDQSGSDWLLQATYPAVIDATLYFPGERTLEGEIKFSSDSGTYLSRVGQTNSYTGYFKDDANDQDSYRTFFSFNTLSLAGETVIDAARLKFYARNINLVSGSQLKVYSGANKWTTLNPPNSTIFNIYNVPVNNMLLDETVSGISAWSALPVAHSVPIDISSLALTGLGWTQIVFSNESIGLPTVPPNNQWSALLTSMTLQGGGFEPILEVDLPFPPPAVQVAILPSTVPTRSLLIYLQDWSIIENYWVLERSTNGTDWQVICDRILTGQQETSPACNALIEYDCTTSSEPLASTPALPDLSYCNIVDSGTQSLPNQVYYYRAYAVDTDRSIDSEYSNIDAAYNEALPVQESISPIVSPRWNAVGTTDTTMPYNASNPVYPDPGGTEYCVSARVPNSTADLDRYYAAYWGGNLYAIVSSANDNAVNGSATCEKPAVWNSRVPMYVVDSQYPYYPNKRWKIASNSQNEENAVTDTVDAYQALLYSRARRPSAPSVSRTDTTTLHLTINTTPSDSGNLNSPLYTPPAPDPFICGDVNNSGVTSESGGANGGDVNYLVAYLHGTVVQPPYMAEADVNSDGSVDWLDVPVLLDYFHGIGALHCREWNNSLNPDWTDYAMSVTSSPASVPATRYVNPVTPTQAGLGSSAVWCDYLRTDCSESGCLEGGNSSCRWNTGVAGSGIDLTGLNYNTCYTFRAKARNENNVEGSEARWCKYANGAKVGFCNVQSDCAAWAGTTCSSNLDYATNAYGGTTMQCTAAAQPDQPTVNCAYDSANQYNCSVILRDGLNPSPGTNYQFQYSNNGSSWNDVGVCSKPDKSNIYHGGCRNNVDCTNWGDLGECKIGTDTVPMPNNSTVLFSTLTCSAGRTTYYYHIRARNVDNSGYSNYSTAGNDGLPPCQPTGFTHTDNPFSPLELAWQWVTPVSALPIVYLDFFDASANECIAGAQDDFCHGLVPPEGQLAGNQTEYPQSRTFSKEKLDINTQYSSYVRAVDFNNKSGVHRAGQPSALAPAYTAIEPVTNVTFEQVASNRIVINTDPAVFSNLSAGLSGVQFRFQNTAQNPPNGGGENGFEGAPTAWIKQNYVADINLSPNRQYCYQARSRNGDGIIGAPGDTNAFAPGTPACKFTLAAQPAQPRLVKEESSSNVTVYMQDDNNPRGDEGEDDTKYSLCVTKYNSINQPEYSVYVTPPTGAYPGQLGVCNGATEYTNAADCATHGTWVANHECLDHEGLVTPADEEDFWSTYGDWGAGDGVTVLGLTSDKYDFKLKARNGEMLETRFGSAATLLIVKNNVVGWAWSSNFGWLSLNCLNFWSNPSQYGYSCGAAQDWGMNVIKFSSSREINPIGGYAWAGSGQGLLDQWKGAENVSNTSGVDSSFSIKSNSNSNIDVDSQGNPHVVWVEDTAIYYAKWDGTAWVNFAGNSGSKDLGVASDERPGSGSTVSFVLDEEDYPHIAYNGGDNNNLIYLWYDGAWHSSKVGGLGGDMENVIMPYLQVDSSGSPHLVWERQYYDPLPYSPPLANVPYSEIFYAQGVVSGTNVTWTRVDSTDAPSRPTDGGCHLVNADETFCFDALNVDYLGFAALALNQSGDPYIAWIESDPTAYRDTDPVHLAFKYWSSGDNAWETIASSAEVSSKLFTSVESTEYASIAVDSDGNPHLAWTGWLDGWFSSRIFYVKGNIQSQQWSDADGEVCQMSGTGQGAGGCGHVYFGGDEARATSIALDNEDRPHIAWFSSEGLAQQEIYYRWWNPQANSDQGAWVTASGDYANADPFDDPNVLVSDSPLINSVSPSLALAGDNQPHFAWKEVEAGGGEIYYNTWQEITTKAGLGWVSFNRGVCSNNSQIACDRDEKCLTGTCLLDNYASTGDTPDGLMYGFCYNTDAPTRHRYGVCGPDALSGRGLDCTEADESIICGGVGYCVYDACRSDTEATDCNIAIGNSCFASYTASFNGVTREIDGWGRVLSLKQDGASDASGWLKMNGQFNDGGSNVGPYKVTGTEVDSQLFFGSPDVNPNEIKMFSMFGWGWQGKDDGSSLSVNAGWAEFMPVNALLGIPWVKTAYSDIYAGQNIELAPPPRGTGDYTSTYLILANGDIQGIPGYYAQSQSGLPTSEYIESGFESLIGGSCSITGYHTPQTCGDAGGNWSGGAGEPFGTDPLAKINITALVTRTDGLNNRYGQEVVDVEGSAGQIVDISSSNAFAPYPAANPVLDGKIYYFHGAESYTISANAVQFMKGDDTHNGNGTIIINGNLEINQNITYDTALLDPGDDISDLPSAAFIVEGNIYVNSKVQTLSAVFVTKDNPNTTDVTEGMISTGRVTPASVKIADKLDDGSVAFLPVPVYKEQFGSPEESVGYNIDSQETDRGFLRFPLDIPAGSEIQRAYLRLTASGTSEIGNPDTFTPRIYLVDTGNMNSLDSYDANGDGNWDELYNIATANGITAPFLTGWNNGSQWVDDREAINESPDLKSLVQHFVNMNDYTQGNAIGIAIKEGNAVSLDRNNTLRFFTYDSGDLNYYPELVIEYSPRRTSISATPTALGSKQGSTYFNTTPNCIDIGWNNSRANRAIMQFVPLGVPEEAEIVNARLRMDICGSGGDSFQVRYGLHEAYPVFDEDFLPNYYDTPTLDSSRVAEVAQTLTAGDWVTGSAVVSDDITRLVSSFIDRDDYSTSSQTFSLRLRRGENEEQNDAGQYRGIDSGMTWLDVDYRVPLHVNGLFVAKGYNFDRKYTKDLAAAEQIVYDGRVVANTPPGLTDFIKALPVYQRVTP